MFLYYSVTLQIYLFRLILSVCPKCCKKIPFCIHKYMYTHLAIRAFICTSYLCSGINYMVIISLFHCGGLHKWGIYYSCKQLQMYTAQTRYKRKSILLGLYLNHIYPWPWMRHAVSFCTIHYIQIILQCIVTVVNTNCVSRCLLKITFWL